MWPLPSPSIQHLSQMTQGCPLPSPIKPHSGPSQWADIPLKTLSRQDWKQAVSPSPAISTQHHLLSPPPPTMSPVAAVAAKAQRHRTLALVSPL